MAFDVGGGDVVVAVVAVVVVVVRLVPITFLSYQFSLLLFAACFAGVSCC